MSDTRRAAAVTHPPAGQVVLTGRLGARYTGNRRYLQQLYEQRKDWMLEPFQHRGQPWVLEPLRNQRGELPWAGEYAGKWLDAASLVAAGPDAALLSQQAVDFAASLAATQEPGGYLGVEADGPTRTSHWDVWNLKYALTGLLTYYEVFQAEPALRAAARCGDWLLGHYGAVIDPGHPFFSGPYEGAVSVDVVDQLVRLYRLTGERKYLDFVSAVAAHFPPVARLRETGQAPLIHAYSLTAYLTGLLDWAVTAGRDEDVAALERVWTDLAQRHAYPTGSLGFSEELKETAPNDVGVLDGKPERHHQETCATVEWLMFTARLYEVTGQARYAAMMEQVIYNALLAAQSSDGLCWMYFTPLRYEKRWFSGPTSCCYWSGPRGLARLPRWIYALDGEGLRVDLYETSHASLRLDSGAVTVEQLSEYPHLGRVTLRLEPERPLTFTLRLRVPPHAGPMTITVNGQPVSATAPVDGYHALRRQWVAGDEVAVAFQLLVRVQSFMRADYGLLVRGPEVLAVDERDNAGLSLDQTALPPAVTLRELGSLNGRYRYQGDALVGGRLAPVVFTPYADCGGDGAHFRTAFPIAL